MNENRIQNIKNLLQKVSAIRKKYDEIAQITGENYNVFNILNLSTKEVRTHSAFIADLLNINGLHGQGKVFLELFFEQIKRKLNADKKNKMPTNEANVYVEENIGVISGDEGGRIDIVIKDNNKQIVIENKIYAGDQEKQLVRYNNKYPNAILLYLTLEEQEVSNYSIEKKDGTKLKLNKDYFNITYHNDIKEWLEKCKEKSVNHPILRETLTQYINLIKQLTGQTMNQKEINEILNIFEDTKNIEYYKDIILFNTEIQNLILNSLKQFMNNFGFITNSNKLSPTKYFTYNDKSKKYNNKIINKFRFWTNYDYFKLKIVLEIFGENSKQCGNKIKEELLKKYKYKNDFEFGIGQGKDYFHILYFEFSIEDFSENFNEKLYVNKKYIDDAFKSLENIIKESKKQD